VTAIKVIKRQMRLAAFRIRLSIVHEQNPKWNDGISVYITCLTLWRLLLPYGYSYTKHPVPDRVKPSFVSFDIRALCMTLSPERQSARMSKLTNDGLTRSGTGCFV